MKIDQWIVHVDLLNYRHPETGTTFQNRVTEEFTEHKNENNEPKKHVKQEQMKSKATRCSNNISHLNVTNKHKITTIQTNLTQED